MTASKRFRSRVRVVTPKRVGRPLQRRNGPISAFGRILLGTLSPLAAFLRRRLFRRRRPSNREDRFPQTARCPTFRGRTFGYALAIRSGEPWLFKGKDFAQTDIILNKPIRSAREIRIYM